MLSEYTTTVVIYADLFTYELIIFSYYIAGFNGILLTLFIDSLIKYMVKNHNKYV